MQLVLTLAVAATVAPLALVVNGATHASVSGTTSIVRPADAAGRGFDAWFNDPAADADMTTRGFDAWFNDPNATSNIVAAFDAWYFDAAERSSSAAGRPAPFDAWFADR